MATNMAPRHGSAAHQQQGMGTKLTKAQQHMHLARSRKISTAQQSSSRIKSREGLPGSKGFIQDMKTKLADTMTCKMVAQEQFLQDRFE